MTSNSLISRLLTAVAAIGTVALVTATPATAGSGSSTGGAKGSGYNAIPGNVSGNVPSVSFEGQPAKEFGDLVALGGKGRTLDSISVLLSSWGCETGGYYADGNCQTTPGATFQMPMTFKIYAATGATRRVADGETTDGDATVTSATAAFVASDVGHPISGTGIPASTTILSVTNGTTIELSANATATATGVTLNIGVTPTALATKTATITVPYRPSASARCTGDDLGKWYNNSDKKCYNGLPNLVTVNMSDLGVTLPPQVIWSVQYNTTTSGYNPIGTTSEECSKVFYGCGYDTLNVGAFSYPNAPFVGADVNEDQVWFDGALETGWTGYRPLGAIKTT